jgi:hypothetical protein
MMIIIETDHNAYTEDTKQQRKIQMAEEMREAAGEDEQVGAGDSGEGGGNPDPIFSWTPIRIPLCLFYLIMQEWNPYFRQQLGMLPT